jgi:hypothetical protein
MTEFTYLTLGSEAREKFDLLCSSPGPVALDLETYGPTPDSGLYPHRGDIRLLTVALPGDVPVIFDLRALGYDSLPWPKLFMSREIVAHNAVFELKWLLGKLSAWPAKVFCTMHAARLLQNGIDGERQHAGLATVLERYLGVALLKAEQTSNFGVETLSRQQLLYAAGDCRHLLALRDTLHGLLVSARGGSLVPVFELDMEHLSCVARRELLGIRFDVSRAEELQRKAGEDMAFAAARLSGLWGNKVLLSSPKQVKAAFASLGVDISETNDDTLKSVDHPAAVLMRKWRTAEARDRELARVLKYVTAIP